MHKLGIHITGHARLETRLYNWRDGFHGEVINASLPDQKSLLLVLTGPDIYQLSLDGDLQMDPEVQEDHGLGIKTFAIHWSDEATARGNGQGKITLVNSRAASEPSTFSVTMGQASLTVAQRQKSENPGQMTAADHHGVFMMLTDIMMRDALRGVL